MTAAATVTQLRDVDWFPTHPWACPAGQLVTSSQVDRATWLEQRRQGLGASDVAAIFGVSRWSTAWDVWAEKTGRVQPEPENDAMRRGRILEDGIAELWAATRPADQPVRLRRAGLMKHRQHPMIMATVDRLSVCQLGRCLTEIKSSVDLSDWGSDDAPETPVEYQLQTQQQLAVTGRDHVHVVVLGPRFQVVERVIDRDDDLIGQMIGQLVNWWANHIEADVEPEATAASVDGLARLYGDPDPGEVVELPSDLWGARAQVRDLNRRIGELEQQRDDLVARVKQHARNASVIKAAGDVIATWKPTRRIAGATAAWRKANTDLVAAYSQPVTTEQLDLERLTTDHPELIGAGQTLYRVRQLRWAD